MSRHNIPFSIQKKKKKKKRKIPKLSQICSYGMFSEGLKNEFETDVVNGKRAISVRATKVLLYCVCRFFCTSTHVAYFIQTFIHFIVSGFMS